MRSAIASRFAARARPRSKISRHPHAPRNQRRHQHQHQTSEPTTRDPTRAQLVKFALAAAIPFAGFGIVDNAIMILAGDSIDLTFGLHFHLSTMASAALGNTVSDVFGLQFGQFIESACARMGLFASDGAMTMEQTLLRSSRRYKRAGKALGLTFGCLLGMFPLLFIDSNQAERLKKQARIDNIFKSVVDAVGDALDAHRATVWLVVAEPGRETVIWTKASKDLVDVKIPINTGIVGRCARSGRVQNVSDPYSDPDFTPSIDRQMKSKTHSILCAPIKLGSETIGVLEVVNKRPPQMAFSYNDEELLISMASHLALPVAEALGLGNYLEEGSSQLKMQLQQCEFSHKTIVLRRDSRVD